MFVITAFFSSILIGFSRFTSDRVKVNQQLAFEKAVLEVFSQAQGKSNFQLHETFLEYIYGFEGSEENICKYVIDEQIQGFAIPVSGKGYWAKIKGVIGVAKDKKTITGISFYEQNETPGLGAEITKAYFRDQFDGKIIALEGKPLNIRPLGTKLDNNSVHAITGATQTCTRLEKLINDDLIEWRKEEMNIAK
jgi:Na+-transporting NADH:ubiquinone oxidoreductase subunit C